MKQNKKQMKEFFLYSLGAIVFLIVNHLIKNKKKMKSTELETIKRIDMKLLDQVEKLIKSYEEYVTGYLGSSMLTNTEYPEMIRANAIQCVKIVVDEMIEENLLLEREPIVEKRLSFWKEAKTLLTTLK